MAEDLMNKMFSFLAGGVDSDKQLLLKQTMKELSQNKFVKFFKAKTEEADTSLAQLFYNVYKVTFPMRIFMQDGGKAALLKQKMVETFMDPALRETVHRLNVEALAQRAGTEAPSQLTAEIQADVSRLFSEFDPARMDSVNRCYNLAAALSQLARFDYPGLLKKFDPNFIGGNWMVEPKFSPVKVEFLYKNFGEFLAVSKAINPEEDWGNLFEMLKSCAGKELIQLQPWIVLAENLREIHQSRILELMVQYSLKQPVWQWKPKIPDERAAELWLETKKAEARKVIDKITSLQKSSQISALAKQIFTGTANLQRLLYYTPELAEPYRKKELEDFYYAEGLNYLKVFLEDYLGKEIQELCDILLVRGQWTNNNLSREMSESVHLLAGLSAPITELDESFSEDGKDGSRLKAAMFKLDRDRTQIRYVNSIIGNNNDEALELINTAAQHFIVIGKQLKMLAEDIQKRPAELVINWKELTAYSREPLGQRIADDCKKINYFVQLLRLCTIIPGAEE